MAFVKIARVSVAISEIRSKEFGLTKDGLSKEKEIRSIENGLERSPELGEHRVQRESGIG